MSGRPVLFYSTWGLGFHNQEAERKANALAALGHDVVYVAGVGIRNPRLSRPGKVLAVAASVLRRGRAAGAGLDRGRGALRTASVLVVPPRQLGAVRRLNRRLVERSLRQAIDDWRRAVAWVRFPTPELIDALRRLDPAAIVYDCVDAWRHVPDFTGRFVEVLDRAERDLLALGALVVVPAEPLAEPYRSWGADVRLLPHGVDLPPFAERSPRGSDGAVIGFVGTLDYRLDLEVLRGVAGARPDWTLRLIGPVAPGFDPDALADLPNVSIEPPVPHSELASTLAEFDAAIMPYFDHPLYERMAPVKNLELLASGVPAVARPNPALAPYAELVRFAATPSEFVAELHDALTSDQPALAHARRAAAEPHTWERRLAALPALMEEALSLRPRTRSS